MTLLLRMLQARRFSIFNDDAQDLTLLNIVFHYKYQIIKKIKKKILTTNLITKNESCEEWGDWPVEPNPTYKYRMLHAHELWILCTNFG